MHFLVPVLRHARVQFVWRKTPTLREFLCKPSTLASYLEGARPPVCKCREILESEPRWPSVLFDGSRHIAAQQGLIPWPTGLRHLVDFPASLNLPCRRGDIVRSILDSFRHLRKRCRIADDGRLAEDTVAGLAEKLWLLAEARAVRAPVQWEHARAAQVFLEGFFVSAFDHNPSRIGAFCPFLVYKQACCALDFREFASQHANITWSHVWSRGGDPDDAVREMAEVPGLPSVLTPSAARVRNSQVGTPQFLPKWKAPGLKWRLIINKKATPCNLLHSLVARAVDVLLDRCAQDLWSDLNDLSLFLPASQFFNSEIKRRFRLPEHCTVAADMVDCFHHIPCASCPRWWDSASEPWRALGFTCISVPRSAGTPGRLGKFEAPGWEVFNFC